MTAGIGDTDDGRLTTRDSRELEAAALVEALEVEGIRIRVIDGRFNCPKTANDEVVAALREYKAELLQILPALHSREPACVCGWNGFWFEPLAFDGTGGDVCGHCRQAVALDAGCRIHDTDKHEKKDQQALVGMEAKGAGHGGLG